MGQLQPRGNSKQEKEIKHVAFATGNGDQQHVILNRKWKSNSWDFDAKIKIRDSNQKTELKTAGIITGNESNNTKRS